MAVRVLTEFGSEDFGGTSGNCFLMLTISVEILPMSTMTWSRLAWRSFREATSGGLVGLQSLDLQHREECDWEHGLRGKQGSRHE